MLREGEELTTWARDPLQGWTDFQLSLDKSFPASHGGLVEKVSEDKLARDVDDLSAIFEGLAEGADFVLPDDLEAAGEAEDVEVTATTTATADETAWIDDLDKDTINVNELSKAFDALVDGGECEFMSVDADVSAVDESSSEEDEEDEEMDESESDEEVEERTGGVFLPSKFVPSAPLWATMAPLDPRSCIRGPVFKALDSRIPQINIPRIDLAPVAAEAVKAASVPSVAHFAPSLSPKASKEKAKAPEYRHDPKTCWICKSSKTPEKKRALHRYLDKRTRRNWKRGPRYAGRSHVATSRVRNGGRFICTTRWI